MRLPSIIVGFVIVLALSAPASLALQQFTLEEAQTRIERLEARVASLEATVAASSGDASEASELHTITGTLIIGSSQHFDLVGTDVGKPGVPCFGSGAFSDINAGASVQARDEAGNVIGLGRLNLGVLVGTAVPLTCELTWTMEVQDADFYAFEVANREGTTFSRAELEQIGWHVDLRIGA